MSVAVRKVPIGGQFEIPIGGYGHMVPPLSSSTFANLPEVGDVLLLPLSALAVGRIV